jgi:hypothetical protein
MALKEALVSQECYKSVTIVFQDCDKSVTKDREGVGRVL